MSVGQAVAMTEVVESVQLYRFVFVLPEPLPFADGSRFTDHIGDQPNAVVREDDPWVTLSIYQEQNTLGRTAGSLKAMTSVTRRIPDLDRLTPGAIEEGKPPQSDDDALSTLLPITYTVVDAITLADSPDDRPDEFEKAQDLPPRADAFNRCLRFTNDLVRAYRVTDSALMGLPTYERIPPTVLAYTADAEHVTVQEDVNGWIVGVREGRWSDPEVMGLEHYNLPDHFAAGPIDEEQLAKFSHYMEMLRYGNPFLQWNEMYIDARRALQVHGNYASAVVLALTASEVMLDGLLSLILWETGATPEQAAARCEEGRITRRVKTDLPPLLGGNWNLDGNGPAGQWFRKAVRLRHRVVHGGYRPTRLEATAAVEAVLAMERHAFTRLVQRRDKYPRSTLMTVAESGLRSRNLWNGKIKKFSETVAPVEDSWQAAFADWRETLIRVSLTSA